MNQEISIHPISPNPKQIIDAGQSKFLFRIKSREDGGEGWFVRVTNPHKGPIDDKTPISWAARWPFVYGLQRGGSASKAMRGRLDWPV